MVVRDESSNPSKPIEGMTVNFATDVDFFVNVTSDVGRVNFHNLCYGDIALLTVFGGSFDTQSCASKQQQFVVGSTEMVTITTTCGEVEAD